MAYRSFLSSSGMIFDCERTAERMRERFTDVDGCVNRWHVNVAFWLAITTMFLVILFGLVVDFCFSRREKQALPSRTEASHGYIVMAYLVMARRCLHALRHRTFRAYLVMAKHCFTH